ncbi:MAG: Fic family protein [Xanthobacteraceae bacterium]
MAEPEQRHSRALEPDLIADPKLKAEAEAKNGLRQFDVGIATVETAVERGVAEFRLRPSTILGLHREALAGISSYAGLWRPAGVEIQGSKHKPSGAHLVPELVENMCDYVNERWQDATAIHLAAYLMWRLNWIHPFADGNGRTARMTSYVVMSIKIGRALAGTPTIPEQIVENRVPYFDALDAADEAFKKGQIDVSKMEELLGALLAKQLMSIYQLAGGKLKAIADSVGEEG